MTKVSIIEIDLGEIDKIIAQDVAELRGEAKGKLEAAIKQRKAINEIKEKRQQQKNQQDNKLKEIMDSAYDRIKESGNEGVPTKEIMELVSPTIKTASAFTTRMKTMLKNEGNKYIIKRKTKNKEPYYIFESFNEEL